LAKATFTIEVWPLALAELAAVRAHQRRRIEDAIPAQLSYEPLKESRNRKPLFGIVADFEFDPPLWELKVGEYRVLYDAKAETSIVNVRAVRHKPPGKTTAEVLR
jgi:mRNA-degrading endonuclease RelE of RelBE toxin-antitoxin system